MLADLHVCGRPMSEAFRVAGRAAPTYVVGETECAACEALERRRAGRSVGRDPESRINPDAWTVDRVYTREEALATQAAQHS